MVQSSIKKIKGHDNPTHLAVVEGDLHALYLSAAAAVGVALDLVGAVGQWDLLVVGLLVRRIKERMSRLRLLEAEANTCLHTRERTG